MFNETMSNKYIYVYLYVSNFVICEIFHFVLNTYNNYITLSLYNSITTIYITIIM